MAIDRLISNAGEDASQSAAGVFDLSGAINATYQTFADSDLADTEATFIRIDSADTNKYEVMEATFSVGTPDTLTRVSTVESSNADSAVDFGTESLQIVGSVLPGGQPAIGSSEIIDGAVGSAEIAAGAVGTSELASAVSGTGLSGGGGSALSVDNYADLARLDLGETVTGAWTFNADVTLGMGDQDYVVQQGSSPTLAFRGQASGSAVAVDLVPFDIDGTDQSTWRTFAVGLPSDTDREYAEFGWDGSSAFVASSWQNGTGTLHPFKVFTGSNTDQIVARTDGNVAMSGSLKVGGAGAASDTAEVAGGLTVGGSSFIAGQRNKWGSQYLTERTASDNLNGHELDIDYAAVHGSVASYTRLIVEMGRPGNLAGRFNDWFYAKVVLLVSSDGSSFHVDGLVEESFRFALNSATIDANGLITLNFDTTVYALDYSASVFHMHTENRPDPR